MFDVVNDQWVVFCTLGKIFSDLYGCYSFVHKKRSVDMLELYTIFWRQLSKRVSRKWVLVNWLYLLVEMETCLSRLEEVQTQCQDDEIKYSFYEVW